MIAAVVPYKGATSKSRLRASITDDERARLSMELLHGVLRVLHRVQAVDLVAVVSPGKIDGVELLHDDGSGLNNALQMTTVWASERGLDGLLVVPADLPFLTPSDIHAILNLLPEGPGGVVAPSKDGGTGALFLRPPTVIQPSFGPGSGGRHAITLRDTGVQTFTLHRSGLAIDIDVPEDLDLLGDQFLDVIWGADGSNHRGSIDGLHQSCKNPSWSNLEE